MARKDAATATYDPEGIRRVAVCLLCLEAPETMSAAETLISARLGPYRLDPAVVQREIRSYFAARH